MENIFVAIVTWDKEYGRSLSLAMLSICRGFIIRIFDADEFLDENRDFDIVLWDGDEAKNSYGGRIVYLAEKPSEVARNISESRYSLYKYASATSMVASIFEIYEALTGRRAVNLKRQDVRIFAFTSSKGGAGCTTMAMALAQEFCRFQGKRVLYLSFEELDSSGSYFPQNPAAKSTAVYLYELFNKMYGIYGSKGGQKQNPPFLDRYMVKDDFGVETFATSRGRNPLRELTVDELHKFTASLIDSGRFDVIIMDIGQWLSKTALKCMEIAEKICFVTETSKRSMREQQYISHIVTHCGEHAEEKLIRIVNGTKENQDAESIKKSEEYTIENTLEVCMCDSFVREDDYVKIFLEGKFGNNINELSGKITEPA